MSKLDSSQYRCTPAFWVLLLLLIPGLISALFLGIGRYRLESHNRMVELTLDYAEIQSLSVATGVPVTDLLKRFKAEGVTGIAVTEDILGDLVATGQVVYEQRPSDTGPLTVIRVTNTSLANRVYKALSVRLAPGMISTKPDAKKDYAQKEFIVHAAPVTLTTMGIGLPPDAVQLVRRSGLDVVARLQNNPAITKGAILAEISVLKQQSITRLICAGEEVLGFKGLVPYAAENIKASGLMFGSVEFAKQKGDARMCSELDSWFIRVHSITGPEMASITPSTAIERFVRAVKERNIRLCYIRLMEISGDDPIESNVNFISAIKQGIEGSDYGIGVASPFKPAARPMRLMVLIALSVAAGSVLLLNSLFSTSSKWTYGLLILGFILAAGLSMVEIGRQGLALISAIIFPTLGVTALIGPYFNSQSGSKQPISKAILLFVGASVVTLCGALIIIGLLADRSYMVKVNQFAGIKVAHLLPLMAVLFVIVTGLPILGKPFSEVRSEAAQNIRKVTGHPLFVWHAIAVVAILVIIGLAVMRTGNDSGVGVSTLELKFRAILDRLLIVRPRTKEFLIGHPALFLGIMFLLTKRRAWGIPLVVFGMLGQVSLLNTFCHIHTPLSISVLRAFNGLALGILVSILIWLVFIRRRTTQ